MSNAMSSINASNKVNVKGLALAGQLIEVIK